MMMGGGARSSAAGKVRSAAGAGMARPAAAEKNGLEKFLHNLHVLVLGILGGAPAAAETTERSTVQSDLQMWLDGVDGLTDARRDAILAMLEEEEVASVEVLATMWRDGDIQQLEDFQALRKGARAALRKAILKLGKGETFPPKSEAASPVSLGMASSPNAAAGSPWGNTLSPNAAASSPGGFGMASSPNAAAGSAGGFGMASSPMAGGAPPGGFGMASSPNAAAASRGGFGMASSPNAAAGSSGGFGMASSPNFGMDSYPQAAALSPEEARAEAERARMEAEMARMEAYAAAQNMGLFFESIEEQGERAETPLFTAAAKGEIGPVQLLLTARANVMARDKYGLTSLCVASRFGRSEVVQHLGEVGGRELIMAASNNGWTALHEASSEGHLEVVQLLGEVGGKELIMAKNKDGNTAKVYAKTNNHTAVSQYLESHGSKKSGFRKWGGKGGISGGRARN